MFNSEKELVSCITKNIHVRSNLIRGNRRSVFTELNLGYGIADVVAVGYESISSLRKNHLEYFDISLLSLIETEKSVTFDRIVYITKSPARRINDSLSSLINEEFVVFRKGYYSSHKKYGDSLTDSIAIEAKLKDWRRALKQAYRYKWFSNKAFVFLPLENIGVAERNIEMFKQYNVGLAGVSEDKGIEVIFSPVEEKPISMKMRIALNEHLLFQSDTQTGGF